MKEKIMVPSKVRIGKAVLMLLVLFAVNQFVFAENATEPDYVGKEKEVTDAGSNSRSLFAIYWGVGFDSQPDASSRTTTTGFRFVVVSNDKIDIRNQLAFCTGVFIMEDLDVTYYKKTLMDKLSIGIMTREGLFRPYGFLKGGIGTCGKELYTFLENPLIGNVGLGTGLDIFATENWSFFMDIEFLGSIYQGKFIPQQGFELGVMYDF